MGSGNPAADPAATTARLRAIFDLAPDALLVADDARRYLDANPAACALLGLSREQIVGRRVDDFAEPGADVEGAWTAFLAKGQLRGDFGLRLPDGRRRLVEFHAVANIATGEHLTALRDVTEERSSARDLLERERAARDLWRENELRLRVLADHLPQMIFMVEPDGTYTFVNRRFTEFTGLDVAALNRGEWRGTLHPDDLDEAARRWARTLQEGVPFEMEFRQRGRDGAFRWFLGRNAPLRDAAGKVTLLLGTSTDIEDRKRAEREEAELRERARRAEAAEEGLRLSQTILDQLPDAVLLADLEGRIVRWSGGASRMYGYTAEEALGRHASFVHPADLRETIHRDIERALLSGDAYQGEMPALRKDGRVFPLELQARLLRDASGAPLWFLGMSRDLTSVQETERQRLELHAEQTARAQAEQSNRQKDEFLAVLSHELRNPLAPILTALELLRLRGRAEREHRVIERQVGHLVRLVDDLLDVSRIARGKVEMHRSVVELSKVVGQAVEMTAPLFEKGRQELRIEVAREGLPVDGDPTRLSQVVSNLLTNAARYTPSGGHVWVSAERSAERVLLRVRDDGQGLDPDLLPRLFERFVQGKRGNGGLGLGLSIVRALVELHGGSAFATSEGPGRGSEFVVQLPLAGGGGPSAVA